MRLAREMGVKTYLVNERERLVLHENVHTIFVLKPSFVEEESRAREIPFRTKDPLVIFQNTVYGS